MNLARLLASASDGRKIARHLLAKVPGLSVGTKLSLDLFPRPHYAFGVYNAARQAAALGRKGITAIELGVAGGNGLVELEKVAAAVEAVLPVKVKTVGFDLGTGLSQPVDYRDLPYVWKQGFFQMDEPALRARLKRSDLVLGDVGTTLPQLEKSLQEMPVGFVAVDLDYYSSSIAALKWLGSIEEIYTLPRTYVYFDDIIGLDDEMHCEHVGELLAIQEFNLLHSHRKLSKINGLYHKRVFPAAWNDLVYILHRFDHAQYCAYAGDTEDKQKRLQ